jgi:hypothetical protein
MVPSTHLHVGIPFGVGDFGDTDGVFEDGTDRMWVHRNDSVPSKEWVCGDYILEYAASLMNRPTLSSTDATDVGGASSDRSVLITSVTNVILC